MRVNHTFQVKDDRELFALKRACLNLRVSYDNKGDGRVLIYCEPSRVEEVRERWVQNLFDDSLDDDDDL